MKNIIEIICDGDDPNRDKNRNIFEYEDMQRLATMTIFVVPDGELVTGGTP